MKAEQNKKLRTDEITTIGVRAKGAWQPYTEVDDLVLDVMGRESFKTNLINIGDTKQRAEKYDDPALLLLNHGQN